MTQFSQRPFIRLRTMEQSNDPLNNDPRISDRISAILKKCIDGETLNAVEQQIFDQWLARSPYNRSVHEDVTNPAILERDMKRMVGVDKKELLGSIKTGVADISKPRILSFFHSRVGRYAAVIAVLLIGAGIYFLFIKESKDNKSVADQNQQPTITPDLQPGKDRAVLQLADGSTIILDEANNGFVGKQAGAGVSKKGGELNYTLTDPASIAKNQMNILWIPEGGKWTADLSDDTRVFLNAESSITYPVVFTGDSREVAVAGEAYFEVAKDARNPFRVTAKDMTVEVLGTHFNVNTYGDKNPVQGTLLEQSVRAKMDVQEIVLKPGQQSVINEDKLQLNPKVDIDYVMAWKNNDFDFKNDNIETIMNQLTGWYGVGFV
jgi:transmembrane sensor